MCDSQLNQNSRDDSKDSADEHSHSETALYYDDTGADSSSEHNLFEEFIESEEQLLSDDDLLFQSDQEGEYQDPYYMIPTRLFVIEDAIKRKFVCYVCLLYILLSFSAAVCILWATTKYLGSELSGHKNAPYTIGFFSLEVSSILTMVESAAGIYGYKRMNKEITNVFRLMMLVRLVFHFLMVLRFGDVNMFGVFLNSYLYFCALKLTNLQKDIFFQFGHAK